MNKLLLATLSPVLLVAVVVGCNSDEPDTTPIPEPQAAAVDANATMVNCVICGDHQFARQTDTPSSAFEDETYYFCAEYCKTTFDKEPTKHAVSEADAVAE